jgi:cytoskeletal protein CcmA (bactofilin family)
MATKKISELPLIVAVSGSQMGGTVLPVVVGGTTDQISVENFSKFITAYSAHTGSAGNTFTGPQIINNNVTITGNEVINGNVTISGRLIVNEVIAQYETASVLFSSGSNKFGDNLLDKHEFTGSTNITGSLIYNNVLVANIDINTINRLQQTTASLQQATQSLQQATSSLQQATQSLQSFTSSQADRNLILSTVTGSINQFTASQLAVNTGLASVTASLNNFSGSTNAFTGAIEKTTASIHLATASLNYFYSFSSSQLIVNTGLASVTASLNNFSGSTNAFTGAIETTTASIHLATASLKYFYQSTSSLNGFTASQDTRNFTLGIVTGSVNRFTASQDDRNYIISQYTASTDAHIVGISAFTSSILAQNSGVASVTASLNQFTASQDNRNLTLSTVTGSLIGITNGLMAFTAALDSTYATDAQLYQLYQATQSLELHSGSMIGITNQLMALTASMKAQSIVSSSTQITNYYKFAETASANTNFYGGLTVTDYSKFGKSGVAKALDIFGGVSVTGSVITQQNTIGGFVGSYYAQWDSFGSQGGDGNASVGYYVGAANDDRKLRITSDRDIQLNHGNGIGRKIQIPRTAIGLGSVVELTGSLNITGSSAIVGDLLVTLGGITGSVLATNGVLSGSVQISELTQIPGIMALTASMKAATILSSSTQIQNYDVFALNSNLYTSTGSLIGITNGLMALTASMKGQAIVSSSQQIIDYNTFAVTSSANTFYGNQTISGSLRVNGPLKGNIISGGLDVNGGITGSVKGNLAGVADYATTIVVANTGTTTDTSLFPTFTLSPVLASYTSLYSHESSSFFFNGVTRRLHMEGFVVSGSNNIAEISGSLNVTGSLTIDNVLTIVPRTTTPTIGTVPTGSIIVSASIGRPKPWMWDGWDWNPLY